MVSKTKHFLLKAPVSKSTYCTKTAVLCMRLFLYEMLTFLNLKSTPQIVYSLWLPTTSWLCPGDTQLHQTGETNRISHKEVVCSCCVVKYVFGSRSWRCNVCACAGMTNRNWCSLVFSWPLHWRVTPITDFWQKITFLLLWDVEEKGRRSVTLFCVAATAVGEGLRVGVNYVVKKGSIWCH